MFLAFIKHRKNEKPSSDFIMLTAKCYEDAIIEAKKLVLGRFDDTYQVYDGSEFDKFVGGIYCLELYECSAFYPIDLNHWRNEAEVFENAAKERGMSKKQRVIEINERLKAIKAERKTLKEEFSQLFPQIYEFNKKMKRTQFVTQVRVVENE